MRFRRGRPVDATPPTERELAIDRYRRGRSTFEREAICNAPFTNLYFSVDGQASPCWLYFPPEVPRWSPERSIADIWNGPEFTAVREALRRDEFIGRCSECEHDILTGNRPLAAAYDFDHPLGEWPSMLELELSNQCNLACVMCHGGLSSRIRRERDHLPPIVSPYDDSFADQVAELLPHLRELRFNGGEPLMQPIVHRILERVAEHRPDLKVTIATNGTVLNDKVRSLMERCSLHFNISIDSLVAERYEEIRVHSDFDTLMANFERFRAYCKANDRTLCVMVNPMRMNWMEMGDYVLWCNERDVHLWFNTIREPRHLALHSLSGEELAAIHEELSRFDRSSLDPRRLTDRGRHNLGVFERFVDHQVATWRDEAYAREESGGVPVALTSTPKT
ncbi:MAG: twitch domain-containing radical SAM protein [Microthrixaceae bacterium]